MEEAEHISHTSSNYGKTEVEEPRRLEEDKNTTMRRCLKFSCCSVLGVLGGLAVFAAIAVLVVVLLAPTGALLMMMVYYIIIYLRQPVTLSHLIKQYPCNRRHKMLIEC